MKSNVPWSIKGIDPDAREAAKRAARAAGMTLGEWMNQQILQASEEDADQGPPITANPVTVDHLRELVASLNRLNDRLQNTEKRSENAISGLNQGLTSALERIQAMERARSTGDYNENLINRIERIESGSVDRRSIDGLKSLEKALSRTLAQFETISGETMTRVEANEHAIEGLSTRVDHMDAQLREAIDALRTDVDQVNDQVARTEQTAQAVMAEAREASRSNDEEFIERTSNKLRILGNEIKRTSDRIQSLDDKMRRLSGKIEASEQRSAEGIGQISQTIAALSQEIVAFDREQGQSVKQARQVIEVASGQADDRLSTLKDSFDAMLMRIEGIADGERAAQAPAASAAPEPEISEEAPEAFEAAPPPPPAQPARSPALSEAPPTAHELPPVPEETEPAAEIETPEAPQEPASPLDTMGPVPDLDFGDGPVEDDFTDTAPTDEDFDAIFGEPLPQKPTEWTDDEDDVAEATAEPPREGTRDEADTDDEDDTERPPMARPGETLTPKQKVILAARARRKRLEAQNAAPQAKAPERAPTEQRRRESEDGEDRRERKPAEERKGFIAGLTDRFTPSRESEETASRDEDEDNSEIDRLRRKYGKQKEERNFPMVPLIVIGVLVVATFGYLLLKDSLMGGISSVQRPAAETPAQTARPDEVSPANVYERGVAMVRQAGTTEQQARGLDLIRRAATSGYPPAQYRLGEFNRLGEGMAQDAAEARRWFREAAEGGNIPAMHRLGSLYASGEGGEKNDFTALSWFERAASYGYLDSIYNLGLLYDPAVELEVEDQILDSASQSYYWYALADRLGDPDAGADAEAVAGALSAEQRQQIDQEVAAWMAQRPVPGANRDL